MLTIRGCLSKQVQLFFGRYISSSRCNYETHYDVLELKRNCSQKEIKTAFIKLSKKYHPDTNSAANTHSKFVKLNEAYTILSRPETRRVYDLSLIPEFVVRKHHNIQYDSTFTPQGDPFKVYRDSSFWENRDRSQDAARAGQPYYGIKGVKRMPNSWILCIVLAFAVLGVGLQFYLINESVTFSRKVLDEESFRNAEILRQVREQAVGVNGNFTVLDQLQSISDKKNSSKSMVTEEKH